MMSAGGSPGGGVEGHDGPRRPEIKIVNSGSGQIREKVRILAFPRNDNPHNAASFHVILVVFGSGRRGRRHLASPVPSHESRAKECVCPLPLDVQ